uniref:Uncharacterized protein n=1 Tax=Knipowitschia caucasica TaxID=637954 RepID=A0AAV2LE31_KNICA
MGGSFISTMRDHAAGGTAVMRTTGAQDKWRVERSRRPCPRRTHKQHRKTRPLPPFYRVSEVKAQGGGNIIVIYVSDGQLGRGDAVGDRLGFGNCNWGVTVLGF